MIPDKDLQKAAQAYEKAVVETLPAPEDCPARFSRAFERKMRRLILRVDHPALYWLSWLLPAAVLAGLAAGYLLLRPGQDAAPPPPPPPPAQSDSVSQPEPAYRYRPAWLPEGCALERETEYGGETMLVYRTAGGGEAVFLYAPDGAAPELPGPGTAVTVDGQPGTLCLGQSKGALNDLFWSDPDGTSFWLSAPFPEADMLRVAESVERVEE